mmetsp:Transcript_8477/g.26598  ORF Transcript_8477/g.26598 Transcript_8477/m.26598 type:complete len:265 (+) Transcript_8477:21-815(+)
MSAAAYADDPEQGMRVAEDEPLVGNKPPLRRSNSSFVHLTQYNVRLGFIRKVLALVLMQVAFTAALSAVFMLVEPVKNYIQANIWVTLLALCMWAACFTIIVFAACCQPCLSLLRHYPQNYVFLSIFTVVMAYFVAAVCTQYDSFSVLLALTITVALVTALTIYAVTTKTDFTMFTGILICCIIGLLFFGLFAMIFQNRVVEIIYGSLGAIIFSIALVIDIQMIVGGGKRHEYMEDDYVLAAMNIYLDIINLFLYILAIVGGKN